MPCAHCDLYFWVYKLEWTKVEILPKKLVSGFCTQKRDVNHIQIFCTNNNNEVKYIQRFYYQVTYKVLKSKLLIIFLKKIYDNITIVKLKIKIIGETNTDVSNLNGLSLAYQHGDLDERGITVERNNYS